MSNVIEVCTPEEAEAGIRLFGATPSQPVPGLSARVKGYVDAVAREPDGHAAWEVHQPNVATDYLLQAVAEGSIDSYLHVFVSPSAEPGLGARYTLADDSGATYGSASGWAGATPTRSYSAVTLTWTVSYTIPSGTRRRVGTIGLHSGILGNPPVQDPLIGANALYAYTILNPAKVQETTQTVEIVYKLTLIPVY